MTVAVPIAALDRVIRAGEDFDTTWAAVEYGPLINDAVVAAMLGEVQRARADVRDGLLFCAASVQPDEVASWQIVYFQQAGAVTSEPNLLAMPADIGRRIAAEGQMQERPGSARSLRRILSLEAVATRELAGSDKPATLYSRSNNLVFPHPIGNCRMVWLAMSTAELSDGDAVSIDGCFESAEKTVQDRLTQGLGEYRPVAHILASIDDGFQRSLVAARSAPALGQSMLFSSASLEQTGGQIKNAVANRGVDSSSSSIGGSNVLSELLRETFRRECKRILGKQFPADTDVQMVKTGFLVTPHGEWSGWLDAGAGAFGLFTRTIVSAVCENQRAVNATIAKYVVVRGKSRASIDVVIILVGGIRAHLESLREDFGGINGVHFCAA